MGPELIWSNITNMCHNTSESIKNKMLDEDSESFEPEIIIKILG